jgi:hypothetical protein
MTRFNGDLLGSWRLLRLGALVGACAATGTGAANPKDGPSTGSTRSPQPRSGQVDTKGIADPFDKLRTGFADSTDSGHQDTKSSGSGCTRIHLARPVAATKS